MYVILYTYIYTYTYTHTYYIISAFSVYFSFIIYQMHSFTIYIYLVNKMNFVNNKEYYLWNYRNKEIYEE